ncbi:MAG: hypothetical protein ACTSR5_18120 [Promethearchaeota archaeon]
MITPFLISERLGLIFFIFFRSTLPQIKYQYPKFSTLGWYPLRLAALFDVSGVTKLQRN